MANVLLTINLIISEFKVKTFEGSYLKSKIYLIYYLIRKL